MASSRQQSSHPGHQTAYQVLNVQQAAAGQIQPRARPRDQPPARDQGLGLGIPQPRHRIVQVQDPGQGARGQEMGPMRLGATARGQGNGHHGPGDTAHTGQANNGGRQGSGGGVSSADPAVKAQVELAMRGLGGLGTRKRGTIIGAIAASGGNNTVSHCYCLAWSHKLSNTHE